MNIDRNFDATETGILMPRGIWTGQIIRQGDVIDEWEDKNLIVNEGLDATLDIMFHGSTQISTWYIGLFKGNYTPVATVTAGTITSASTEATEYDESTRVAYNEAAASTQSITNSANKATFTFNDTITVYGAFLVSASAKSATTGSLFSAARFGTAKSVVSGDQMLLTYTITAASA